MLQKLKKVKYLSPYVIDVSGLLLGIFFLVYGTNLLQAKWTVYIIILLAFCLMYESLNRCSSRIICIVLLTAFWLLLVGFFFQDSYPWFKTVGRLGALFFSIGHAAQLIQVRKLYQKQKNEIL